MTRDQLQAVEDLEKGLGIPSGFFRKLLRDDDWSFIIKLQAFVESSVSKLLESVFHEPPVLAEFVRKLNLVGAVSKISLLKKLELIESFEESYIEGLARIRNKLVHDITSLGFDLVSHVRDLSEDKATAFVQSTCGIYGYDGSNREKILGDPKAYLWWCGVYVCGCMSIRIDTEGHRRRARDAERRILELQAEQGRQAMQPVSRPAISKDDLERIAKILSNETAHDAGNAGTSEQI